MSPPSYSSSISIFPRSPSCGLKVSHAAKQTCMKTSLYPSPLPPSLYSFPLFPREQKGKLAASFSLPKGLFKLESLQSPPLPHFIYLFICFIFFFLPTISYLFFSAGGDFLLCSLMASGVPSVPGNFCFVEWNWWKEMSWERGEEMRKREEGSVEVGSV